MPTASSKTTCGYAELESALRAVTGASPGVLHGRLKRLMNLGLPLSPGPGTGGRRAYDEADREQLLLAIEMVQMGVKPEIAAALIRQYWSVLAGPFRAIRRAKASNVPNEIFFYVRAAYMTDDLSDDVPENIGWFARFDWKLIDGKKQWVDRFAERVLGELQEHHDRLDDFRPRLQITNLSWVKHRFDAALAVAQPRPVRASQSA